MLKRSKFLIAFLVVTVICASVGFAAVSDTLKTSGTFKVDADNTEAANQFDANIYFSEVSVTNTMTIGNDNSVTGTEKATDVNDTLTIAVPDNTLNKVGDKYTVTATVKNDNSSTASISVTNSTNTASEYVTVTVTAANNATEIAANDTLVYTIELVMVKVPSADINATFSFDIVATAND